MSGTEDNQKIQKITNLLEKGGTMLASHHKCGAPMFRYQGRTLCPVCDIKEEKAPIPEIKPQQMKEAKKMPVQDVADKKKLEEPVSEYDQIKACISGKILAIAKSIDHETDLRRVRDEMDCIELGIKILKLLED